jgi:hypothetical protein
MNAANAPDPKNLRRVVVDIVPHGELVSIVQLCANHTLLTIGQRELCGTRCRGSVVCCFCRIRGHTAVYLTNQSRLLFLSFCFFLPLHIAPRADMMHTDAC